MPPRKDNILLTGFMGAGKSDTARELAKITGLFAIDTDELVESLVGMRIADIFAAQGEAAFRALEQRTADWLAASVDHTIVATGGGFFMVRGFMELGRVFFLDVDFEIIRARLGSGPQAAKRPLFQDIDAARARFAERLPGYRAAAHHIIRAGNRSCADIAREIIGLL